MKNPVNNFQDWSIVITAIVVCGAIMSGACTSDDYTPTADLLPTESFHLLSRSGEVPTTIDATTAEYAATKIMNAPVDGIEVSSPKTASGSTTITNANGEPVMYAVNFEPAGGYVIVSASRKTMPVIATSDKGSYDPSKTLSPFIARLLDRACRHITASFNYPSDSLSAYADHWAAVLPPAPPSTNRLKTAAAEEYKKILEQVEKEWRAQGYEVYNAQTWQKGENGAYRYLSGLDLLLKDLKAPVSWADGKPMKELSYIIVRHLPTYATSGEKCDPITTDWNVDAPYNAAVPGGMPLSSEAVAVGQILHYFKHPTILNYSASSSNPLRNNTEISNFLYSVALNVNTVFQPTYSYATYENVKTALSMKYGCTFQSGKINGDNLIYSINNGSPSIIFEEDENNRSYAWICDGYRIVSDRIDYFLMAPLGQPEDLMHGFESIAQWDEYGSASHQFHNSSNNIYFNTFVNQDSLTWFSKTPNYVYKFENHSDKDKN